MIIPLQEFTLFICFMLFPLCVHSRYQFRFHRAKNYLKFFRLSSIKECCYDHLLLPSWLLIKPNSKQLHQSNLLILQYDNITEKLANNELLQDIHPLEYEYIEKLYENKNYSFLRYNTYLLGRYSIRNLAKSLKLEDDFNNHAILINKETKAPILPENISCSISHKNNYVVTILSNSTNNGTCYFGIDIELMNYNSKFDIKEKVLTIYEQSYLGKSYLNEAQEVMLLFSMKEAIYKALFHILKRPIMFHEVHCVLDNKNTNSIKVTFQSQDMKELNLKCNTYWTIFQKDYFLSIANVHL